MKPSFTISIPLEGFTRQHQRFIVGYGFTKKEECEHLDHKLVKALSKLAVPGDVIELRSCVPTGWGRTRYITGHVERLTIPVNRDEWRLEKNMGILRKFVQVS